MKWFVRLAVAFVSMTSVVVATPGVSSAACGANMSYNWATNECKPPPPMPAWYTPPPAYAPSFAGQDVPPPPPRPWWSPNEPMWNAALRQWGTYFTGSWVAY
jgi:hypothetical protein